MRSGGELASGTHWEETRYIQQHNHTQNKPGTSSGAVRARMDDFDLALLLDHDGRYITTPRRCAYVWLQSVVETSGARLCCHKSAQRQARPPPRLFLPLTAHPGLVLDRAAVLYAEAVQSPAPPWPVQLRTHARSTAMRDPGHSRPLPTSSTLSARNLARNPFSEDGEHAETDRAHVCAP